MKSLFFSKYTIGLILIYVALFLLLPHRVFWSPDEGCKYLQMLGEENQHKQLIYQARPFDPNESYYPQGNIFPKHALENPTCITYCWPRGFPFISYRLYRFFGLAGIYILPLLGGIGCCLICAFLVCSGKGNSASALLLVGLCSPLIFYSILFWEHTVALFGFLLALAFVWPDIMSGSLKKGFFLRLTTAGLLLFFSCYLRHELLLAAAVLGMTYILTTRFFSAQEMLRKSGLVLLGCIFMLGYAWLRTKSSHADGVIYPSYTDILATAQSRIFSISAILEAANYARSILINTSEEFGVPLSESAGWLALAAIIPAVFSTSFRKAGIPTWVFGMTVLLITSAICLLLPNYRAFHSIFLPAPWLLIVFYPLPKDRLTRQASLSQYMTGGYILLFLLVSWLAGRTNGGPEWGSRFALAVYPLGAIATSLRLSWTAEWASGKFWSRAAVILALAACITGAVHASHGIWEITRTKAKLITLEQRLRAMPEHAIATDIWWLPSALAPLYSERFMYTLNRGDELQDWVEQVALPNHQDLLFVGYSLPPCFMPPNEIASAGPLNVERLSGILLMNWQVDSDQGVKD